MAVAFNAKLKPIMMVLTAIVPDVPIVISLTADGSLFFNDSPVPDGGLPAVLSAQPRESAVVVRADKVTLLEKFVALVDEIRGLGFQQVSLEVIRL